jgi:hypothetical protein
MRLTERYRALERNPNDLIDDTASLNLIAISKDIQRVLGRADQELLENLHLYVERIMLYRITRVKDKTTELRAFRIALLEAGSLNENPEVALKRASEVESVATQGSMALPSKVFSTMVEATESLNGKQLFYILEKLRHEPLSQPIY